MAFWGCEFLFDGIPSSQYGLMVYDFGDNKQEDVDFKTGEIIEDRLPSRFDALTYGLNQNQALEYTLVFGANMDSIDANDSIDRFDVDAIATWLTAHNQRKWLTIVQSDMEIFRYKCFISELRLITSGKYPWAFSCRVNCDSKFSYTFPEEYEYDIDGTERIRFLNRSSYSGYFRPVTVIELKSGNNVSIKNETDNNREFAFKGIPDSGSLVITVDNKNQVITNSADINLYKYFNMRYLRLLRGDNYLVVTGNMKLKLICEFPINTGG